MTKSELEKEKLIKRDEELIKCASEILKEDDSFFSENMGLYIDFLESRIKGHKKEMARERLKEQQEEILKYLCLLSSSEWEELKDKLFKDFYKTSCPLFAYKAAVEQCKEEGI